MPSHEHESHGGFCRGSMKSNGLSRATSSPCRQRRVRLAGKAAAGVGWRQQRADEKRQENRHAQLESRIVGGRRHAGPSKVGDYLVLGQLLRSLA